MKQPDNKLIRDGNVVSIVLTMNDDYQAMMVYDKLKKQVAELGVIYLPFGPTLVTRETEKK